jgi:phospho-N-acetylmuramoyl-pentapeptide-transferase
MMLYRVLNELIDPAAQAGVRPAMAGATALVVTLALGRPVIGYLRRLKIGERTECTPIEDEQLRERIADKSGTPTMGGVFLLGGVLAGTLLWAPASLPVALTLLCTVALAVLGAADDRGKLMGTAARDRGLKARHKMAFQACVGAAVGGLLLARGTSGGPATLVPVLGRLGFLAGPAVIAWAALNTGLMSNGTNITDGLDGLLSGLVVFAAGIMAVACTASGSTDMAVYFAAVAGACAGFLWYNRHPARVFMGDTGSLAIGGGMACAAMMAGLEVLMLLVGAVFLAEFGSSLLQIFWFKTTGRRILPIAPLHHIPQKKDVPEPAIVRGFYMGGLVAALLGLALLTLGN